MRRSARPARVLCFCAVVSSALVVTGGRAGADPDDGDDGDRSGDELVDIADPPGPDVVDDERATAAGRPTAATTTGPIDDFRYDDLVLEGTAAEVCAGRALPGTVWTLDELIDRFGGSWGGTYVCRERWDAANDPDCNGTVVDPVSQPDFHSTCWSNHARGRALDLMVGTSGGGYNFARGEAVVNWLLATDGAGNQNALARRLGVQQILFADRCWNSDGDRGIDTWSEMRECGIGHHDHVHIDMTVPGADGAVTYWGAAPEIAPKHNWLLAWDRESGQWTTRRYVNGVDSVQRTAAWPTRYDELIAGDWDADGRTDDVVLWDRDTGRWQVRSFGPKRVRRQATGRWGVRFDQIVAGDFNGDGKINDLFFYDTETGAWAVQSWWHFAVGRAASGQWSTGFDDIAVGDTNEDGRTNDMVLWDRDAGDWVVRRWRERRARQVSSGGWNTRFDRVVAGDFDAGGDLDETLLWDVDAGDWFIHDWEAHWPRSRAVGSFDRSIDDLVLADLDTDGRLDDGLVRDVDTGRWTIHTWHRFHRTTVRRGMWPAGQDQVLAGTWR